MEKSKLISVDGEPATVIAPHKFKSGKTGWYGQQFTTVDGEKVTIQVMIYRQEK